MVTRIRELLELRQLSPTQFADFIGVGRPVMSHILSERNKPSLEVVQKIITAFPDIALPWLLSGAGPMLASAALVTPAAAAAPPEPLLVPVLEAPAAPPVVAGPLPVPTIPPAPQHSSIPSNGVNGATSVSRPLPPKFRPTKATAAIASAGPQSTTASTDTAPLSSLPTPAVGAVPVPLPLASTEATAVSTSASIAAPLVATPTIAAPLPSAPPIISSAPLQAGSTVQGYIPAELAREYQQVPATSQLGSPSAASYAPVAPVVPSASPTAPWVAPATEVATPNPAAALSFLGEPGRAIRRIVIFYRDGSFSDYVPEGQ